MEEIKKKMNNLKKQHPDNANLKEILEKEILNDFFPESDKPNVRTHDLVHAIVDNNDLTAYSDLTGRFPYMSSRGSQYLYVVYHYDSNAIIAEPLKNRAKTSIIEAWTKINERFKHIGLMPNIYVMDNECSSDLKATLGKEKIAFQLVPPHDHRRNAAERAIQTLKNHLKAGLATVDPNFPIKEWDRLIDQCEITLNLLRASRVNPKLSAYAYLNGIFDYNKTPLAPPGTKVVAHDLPNQRPSWAPNGQEGWTVGPAKEHY